MNCKVRVEVVSEVAMVEMPYELLNNIVPLWGDFLERRSLDLAPHVARFHIIVNKIWCLGSNS